MTEYEYSPFGFVNSHERAQTWFPCKDKHTDLMDSIDALRSKQVYYDAKLKKLEELLKDTNYPKTRLFEMKKHTAKKIKTIEARIKTIEERQRQNANNDVPQSPARKRGRP
jgi:predicted nuclease with TOPRIM domain